MQEKWVQYVNKSFIKGDDTAEFTIASSVFTTNPDVEKWKVEFSLTAVSKQNGESRFLRVFWRHRKKGDFPGDRRPGSFEYQINLILTNSFF